MAHIFGNGRGPTFRRLAPLLLIGLAAIAALVLIPWVMHAQTPANQSATGRPVVLASAEGAGILFADTEGIADGNGLPIVVVSDYNTFTWSYQWIRVDGNSETDVGADSASYQPVEADVGKLIEVEVSFMDGDNHSETVTSLPFGPIAELAGPSAPPSTLVSNTGQSASATANITQQYALGFRLGDHGQGYGISSVSIELAAVPSSLTVSLWSGGVQDAAQANTANKLFDFANPSSFAVGLNQFTAPAGAFAYQNVNYFIVLSVKVNLPLSQSTSTASADKLGPSTPSVILKRLGWSSIPRFERSKPSSSTSIRSCLSRCLETSSSGPGSGGDTFSLIRVDYGRGQDRTLRGMAPVECAIDGWS